MTQRGMRQPFDRTHSKRRKKIYNKNKKKNFQFTTDKIAIDDRVSHYVWTKQALLVYL